MKSTIGNTTTTTRTERQDRDETFTIWQAFEPTMSGADSPIGYLVTDADNPDVPVAFVHYEDGGHPDERVSAFRLAEAIAYTNPDATNGRWLDLRGCGRLDSIDAMPRFIFGLLLAEVDEDGLDIGKDRWECEPFCRFELERLREQGDIERERSGSPSQFQPGDDPPISLDIELPTVEEMLAREAAAK